MEFYETGGSTLPAPWVAAFLLACLMTVTHVVEAAAFLFFHKTHYSYHARRRDQYSLDHSKPDGAGARTRCPPGPLTDDDSLQCETPASSN